MAKETEALAIGDNLGMLKKLIDFIKQIDPAQVNSVLAFMVNILTMLFGAAGLQTKSAVLTEPEQKTLAESDIEAAMFGIDMDLVKQLFALLLQILAYFKKPAPLPVPPAKH
jgi:hypothetical protein